MSVTPHFTYTKLTKANKRLIKRLAKLMKPALEGLSKK